MRVKIWFAAAVPENSQGGVNRNIRGLAAALRKQGAVVDVIYCGATRVGSNYLFFGVALLLKLLLSWPALPDCIIARSTDGFFCALFIRIARLKTRIYLHNHGWEERVYALARRATGRYPRPRVTWKSALLRYPLLRATLCLCHRCVCGTLDDIRWLKKKFPAQGGKWLYVPNGVSVSHPGYWNERHERPHIFLSVGGLIWRKNLNHTIAVFREINAVIPGSALHCVGTGINDARQLPVEGMAPEAIVNKAAENMRDMEKWYETCPYMIVSSRYEGGHSLALLEAMAHGIVVFAVNIPATAEFIRDGVNGVLLDGLCAADDARKIIGIVGDNALVRETGYRASRTATRNTWERQGSRLHRALA